MIIQQLVLISVQVFDLNILIVLNVYLCIFMYWFDFILVLNATFYIYVLYEFMHLCHHFVWNSASSIT